MAGFGGGMMDMPISPQSAIYRYGNAGRILTFKLDGGAVPKPGLLPDLPFPTPPHREGTRTEIARGDILYSRYCSRCHVFGRGELPDLRKVASLPPRGFDAIVLKGALESKGMARWDDVLSAADATAIQDYLIDQAWEAYAAASTVTHK
jgi:quinohemoprotein ethanol dehydrogenase